MAPWPSHLETPLNSLLSMTMLEVNDRISLGLYSLQSLPHFGGKLGVQGFTIVTYLFKLETVNSFLSSNLWFWVMKWFLAADVFFFFFLIILHISHTQSLFPDVVHISHTQSLFPDVVLKYLYFIAFYQLVSLFIGTTYLEWEAGTYTLLILTLVYFIHLTHFTGYFLFNPLKTPSSTAHSLQVARHRISGLYIHFYFCLQKSQYNSEFLSLLLISYWK